MWTTLSVLLVIVATLAFLLNSYAVMLLCLMVSALLFIRGNRIKRERLEAERHRETVAILRNKQ